MIGHSLSAVSRTVTRSGARVASIIGVALVASTAQGQANPAPPNPPPVTTDTTNQLVVSSDTTKEVTHTVKKGDTLWDLAKFYLKDPFRWPEIFRRNTDVVENPHWIYPGEVIRIWGSEVRPDALAKADSAGEVVSHVSTRPVTQSSDNGGGQSDLTIFASPMSRATAAIATSSDVIGRSHGGGVRRGEVEAAPYIERSGGPRGSGRLAATVDRAGIKASTIGARFQLNDDLYIEMPKGVAPRIGDTYMSYSLGSEVSDLGQVLIPTGVLRIESVSGRTLARIIKQYGPIELEQGILPMPDLAMPSGPLSPVASTAYAGKVVYVHDDPVLPSIGHYVMVSGGSRNGVHMGDQYTFIDQSVGREDDRPAPPVIAGVGQVVRVTPNASTVIITGQVQPTIREGMPVRLSGRMP